MGSVGDCFDNAMCESFFATLECGLIARRAWKARAQARQDVFRFIDSSRAGTIRTGGTPPSN
jgi:putative transposase